MPYYGIKIPAECERFEEAIEKIILHEKHIYEDFDKSYCYICVDQRNVEERQSQRRTDEHSDSFPTRRVFERNKCDNIYLVYYCIPTEF